MTRLNRGGGLGIATAYSGARVLHPPSITTPRRHEHLHTHYCPYSRCAHGFTVTQIPGNMPNKAKGLSKKGMWELIDTRCWMRLMVVILFSGSRAKRQNSKSSQYKYTSLQTPQSIRLLQLSRGERDDPIQCYLYEVRLHDWPLYEAVSYAWGDPNDKSVLNCNNKTIFVPRNLVEGLRMFRRPDRLRILWADAVCINQKDL